MEDQHFFRLIIFFQKVATKTFNCVFKNSLADIQPTETLWDYYGRNGIDVPKLKRMMNTSQHQKVDTDPSGSSFDLTLLHLCLRNGYHQLSNSNDDKWKGADNTSIESLLTKVKKERNDLALDNLTFNSQELKAKIEDLKGKLIQILEFCRTLYGLPDATADQEIAYVKDSVKRYLEDDFNQTTFEECKTSLICDALMDHLDAEGWDELVKHFEKVHELEKNPVNHIEQFDPFPLQEIYVEMDMEGKELNQTQPLTYEDLLLDETGNRGDKPKSVIVVSAPAGLGKTTLTKKLTLDWISRSKDVKHLAEHDFLLKIECKNRCVSNLEELIKYSMPKTSKSYKSDDIKDTLLHLKLMIVLDGYDEINEVSDKLFKELLQLQKKFAFTFLITTKPEKLIHLKKQLEDASIGIKHITLKGISSNSKYNLAEKYYREIAKKHPHAPEFEGLKKYLKRTEHKLADLWRSPCNVIMATILYVYRNGAISELKTAPRLHREIHYLCMEKLLMYIKTKVSTHMMTDKQRDNMMHHFMYVLTRESLVALRDDHIILPESSYDNLKEVCQYHSIDVDEMLEAFLQCTSSPSNSQKTYSFLDKEMQHFMAAVFIWMELIEESKTFEVDEFLKDIIHSAQQHDIPCTVIEGICMLANQERERHSSGLMVNASVKSSAIASMQKVRENITGSLSSSSDIQEILEAMEISCKSDISKYKDMLKSLLGIFFLEKTTVTDEHRLELLRLLPKSGIGTVEDWISVLIDVECDEFVLSFVGKTLSMLKGSALIEDHSLPAYISLLKALETPVRDLSKIKVSLDIKGELDGFVEVLTLIHQHQLKLETIVINKNFQEMTEAFRDPKFPPLGPIDLNVQVGLDAIHELLKVIREKQLVVRSLQLKDNVILINDSNATAYQQALAVLPQLTEEAFGGSMELRISQECPSLESILADINRNKILVTELRLENVFRKASSVSQTTKDNLDEVVMQCHQSMSAYTGPMTDAVIHLITRLETPRISIHTVEELSTLSAAVAETKHSLKQLGVCVDPEVASSDLIAVSPLNGVPSVRLLLPDVGNLMTSSAAGNFAKKLMPKHPKKGYGNLVFPDLQCSPDEVLKNLQDVEVTEYLFFPLAYQPKDAGEERKITQAAMDKTGCLGIKWFDVDDLEYECP